MINLLKDYAVKNVWCSPEQDNQVILAAKRITRNGGNTVSVNVMTRRLNLPDNKKYYHVYQIGQAHPVILGLLPNNPEWASRTWCKFSDAINTLDLFCDLYTDKGVHIPLYQSYYMYTDDRALVFCIEINNALDVNFDQEQIYLRLYTNAYYQSDESNNLTTNTLIEGKTVISTNDILSIQSLEANWKGYPGAVLPFVNGNLVDGISPFTARAGDFVEIIHDASIKRVVDLKISDLKSYTSILDREYKYWLHYPETTDQVIDFVDDIDVYIVSKTGNREIGRYIHKNRVQTLSNVTYRDYGLSVNVVRNVGEELISYLTNLTMDLQDFYVRLYIRHSGLTRPLVYDKHRQFELYKLDDESVKQAVIGADAVVPFWTAAELENSAYLKLLKADYQDIDIDLLEKAFGYNAISKIIADGPLLGEQQLTRKIFELPAGLQQNSTIYEYDQEGLLLGYYPHNYGGSHIAINENCFMIEGIVGIGSERSSVVFGTNNIPMPKPYSYKVYFGYIKESGQVEQWIDVTDNLDYYEVINEKLSWKVPEEDYLLMVRSDERFLAYDLQITPIAGTIYFDLYELIGEDYRLMDVPLGSLDIWLNGYSLVPGIDSQVEFPKVFINAKDYLIQPAGSTPQKVTIRFTGFSETIDGKFVLESHGDTGFIEHGVLSNNSRYDIRDDKVLRITTKGRLKHRADLIFSEEHPGVSITDAKNGFPYQIRDVLVPLRNMTYSDTYRLKQESKAIDKAVSDYMTLKLPQPERNAPSAIVNRHRLVSPFFSHLINDLASGQFNYSLIRDQPLTDSLVKEICQPYEYLLKFDPLNPTNRIDPRLVLIHPHQLETTIALDVYSYAFMKRVTKLYGNNQINLSAHLTVNTNSGEV